jgi:hypothetical protein
MALASEILGLKILALITSLMDCSDLVVEAMPCETRAQASIVPTALKSITEVVT